MSARERKEHILFLHIPKTGGTTLRQIFTHQYADLGEHAIHEVKKRDETGALLNLDPAQKARLKLVIGHFYYGIHAQLGGDFRYVTFLRNPVKRVISSYYFAKWDVNHDTHRRIHEEGIGLVEYLCSGRYPWLENGQVKLIAGAGDLRKPCDEAMYRQALEHLDRDFLCAGILERFDESLICMKNALGWSWPFYAVENVTPKSVQGDALDDTDLERIGALNRFDQRLYEEVNARLDQRIAETPAFRAHLFAFRALRRLRALI